MPNARMHECNACRNARKDLGMIFQKTWELMCNFEKWGSKCKDLEKIGSFYARCLKTGGPECNFAKCKVQNAILQGKYALGHVLKSYGWLTYNFEICRGWNAIL